MTMMLTVALLLLGISFVAYADAQQFYCVNPNNNNGYCYSIYECPSLLQVVQKTSISRSERNFLQRSQCQNGYGRSPFVCCTPDTDFLNDAAAMTTTTTASTTPPTTTTTATTKTTTTTRAASTRSTTGKIMPAPGQGNMLPVPPFCGPNSLQNKLYNGKETALDEFPWMVLLDYVDKTGKRLLNCGGSLINRRYVLTAAHCITDAKAQDLGRLTRVRLGEHDINSETDCTEFFCNDPVVEVGIEEVILHPDFSASKADRHNDIALLRLDQDVVYTDFIYPVCLPVASTRQAITTGDVLTVSGWGRTLLARMSSVKQQLNLPVADHAACAQKFQSRRINLISKQLCAGGAFAEDSCDGDSGGPLMRRGQDSRWFVEGIVSFGNRCGLEGWPGVYTRVADYIDWIQSTVKP